MTALEREPEPLEPLGPATGETISFSHTLRPREYVGLSVKNGLLNLVTLTLYRFWGRTEVRRRVWSAVRLNGEPFEYVGTGRELFVGFLIAMLVVSLPLLLVVFAAQFMDPLVGAAVIFVVYLGLFWLMGAGVFLAFRYTVSRTTWRGIRFQLTGSPAGFGGRYLGHLLLSGVTLGWWWPAAVMKINGALWGGLRFGDRRFRWSRSEDGVYGAYAIGWLGAVVGYIGLAIVLFGGMALMLGGENVPEEPSAEMILLVYAFLVVFGVFLAAIFAPFHAAVLRATARSVRLDDARFRLDVRALDLLGLTLSNGLLLVVTLGFAAPYVQARTARFLVQRLTATGEVDLAHARQAERGPGQGEGLADAFGLAPI